MSLVLKKTVVIIVNYNSANLCIKNAKNLIEKCPEIEIIIVDNCSTDDSVLKLQYALEYKTVHILKSNENKGYAVGNNIGLRYIEKNMTSKEYVIISNPDIIINDSATISKLIDKLNCYDDLGIVSAQFYYNNKWRGINDCGWKFPTPKYEMFAGTFFGKIIIKNINNFYDEIERKENFAYMDVVPGCFFVAKMSALKSINFFDENTFLYFEETILAKRLLEVGLKEGIVIDTFIYHNHLERDNQLIDYRKRLFDRESFHKSKMYYIKYYSSSSKVVKMISFVINKIDINLKRFIFRMLDKNKR